MWPVKKVSHPCYFHFNIVGIAIVTRRTKKLCALFTTFPEENSMGSYRSGQSQSRNPTWDPRLIYLSPWQTQIPLHLGASWDPRTKFWHKFCLKFVLSTIWTIPLPLPHYQPKCNVLPLQTFRQGLAPAPAASIAALAGPTAVAPAQQSAVAMDVATDYEDFSSDLSTTKLPTDWENASFECFNKDQSNLESKHHGYILTKKADLQNLEIKNAHADKVNAALDTCEPIDDVMPPKFFTPKIFIEAHRVFQG